MGDEGHGVGKMGLFPPGRSWRPSSLHPPTPCEADPGAAPACWDPSRNYPSSPRPASRLSAAGKVQSILGLTSPLSHLRRRGSFELDFLFSMLTFVWLSQ